MTKKSSGKGRAATGVTPQGTSEDAEFAQDPKTELENRAKKAIRNVNSKEKFMHGVSHVYFRAFLYTLLENNIKSNVKQSKS